MNDVPKNLVAIVMMICVVILQICAWILGFDGQVFALTTSIITGLAGLLFGFSVAKKQE